MYSMVAHRIYHFVGYRHCLIYTMYCHEVPKSCSSTREMQHANGCTPIYAFRRNEECGGSVTKSLTRGRMVACSILTGDTALCPLARHFILSLVVIY